MWVVLLVGGIVLIPIFFLWRSRRNAGRELQYTRIAVSDSEVKELSSVSRTSEILQPSNFEYEVYDHGKHPNQIDLMRNLFFGPGA
jgi:hypothetical protein